MERGGNFIQHFGDIKEMRGDQIPAVDVVSGGSPCQDLSVAGLRQGLAGERSGLFREQIRVIKEMRQHDQEVNGHKGKDVKCRWVIWENVPGAMSSNGGKDFQAVLTEFARIANPEAPTVPMPKNGKWPKAGCLLGMGADGTEFSVAWRQHDAQWWGVAQRRKRIAVVGDLGGLRAPEVLFERQSMCGDPAAGE